MPSEKVFIANAKGGGGGSPKAPAGGGGKGGGGIDLGALGAGLPARKDRIEVAPKTIRKAAIVEPKRPRPPNIPFQF